MKKTFQEIQDGAKEDIAKTLMKKAKVYNDFAKMEGCNKKIFYKRKNILLNQLMNRCRSQVSIIDDSIVHNHKGIFIVQLRGKNKGIKGLHTHNQWLKHINTIS